MIIQVDEKHKLSQLVGFHKPAELPPFFLSENYLFDIKDNIKELFVSENFAQNHITQ